MTAVGLHRVLLPGVRSCLGLFDACLWLQNSRRVRAGVEQTSGEETAGSRDAVMWAMAIDGLAPSVASWFGGRGKLSIGCHHGE